LYRSFSQEQRQELETGIAAETAQGRRVLVFACRHEPVPLYDQHGEPTLPVDLIPLGLVCLRDQLRPEASKTLTAFAEAGIQLKFISGDHPDTVAALVKQAGFQIGKGTLSGEALSSMDAARLAQAAEEHSVFGRISPQQKASLVQALRRRGHRVAMVGDGVNDVLSLKQADLGIAMPTRCATSG
jgi:cation-transporting ATPase E